ncbi:type I polyketide synthase [Streptomyces sp. NK08204]|uniref:type I polyketide synthase n=1 Tax=Streptomyces sp. NK08204 TaxID=2873260 RepID=UPI001CEE0050|nr:type I polyketide synthase [Streptomyces sp. NK08204]
MSEPGIDQEPEQERGGDRDLDRIAVIGMAGRFPGSPDIETFWSHLEQGREGITTFTDGELVADGVDPTLLERDDYVKAKGVLQDADLFDEGFFGYSPREAEIMDPQHRVFLECAWQALESAGVDPHRFDGRIGVFAGAGFNSYLLFNLMNNQPVLDKAGMYQVLLSGDKDFLATRTSYKLDLKGPSVTVQTACSTSLTAVHLACQSLLNGECDIALAGGVSVSAPLRSGYVHEPGGILSPDGHCRAFDADASGTVAGNGVGVVVLRRLADARDGSDSIDAVILATAVNNDGSLKAGYTAPSVDGQTEVIAEALALADIDPATVGYVETHGTGTPLGDPIEIAALTRAFRDGTDDQGYCAIGSVKSNVGHLDAAAGVTGLIKAALALKHQAIPPTLHCDRPNPDLALDTSPFYVNTELRPWPRTDEPRRAGVSSFGIGGTNVHVLLEEAPAPTTDVPEPGRALRLLTLSGKTPQALADNARSLAEHLQRHPDTDLDAAAYTLACRRHAFDHRATVVCRGVEDAVTALRDLAQAAPAQACAERAPVAFLFPGQGAQYVGMGRELYAHETVFAVEFDRCAELFAEHLGHDLRDLVFAPDGDAEATARLTRTEFAQAALFSVEYALARLWSSWGVAPQAMAGHSIGEFVAATVAGVFSLPDAARLVAARGRLVQEMPEGAMLTVFLPEAETAGWLEEGLSVAAVNSTALTVVSGSEQAIDGLEARLQAASVACRRLHTSHAFHSPDMAGAVEPFVDEVRKATLRAPEIPFLSNVTGTWITDEQATSPEYWGAQLREPVRFRDALDVLFADPALVPLEVGPGQTLANFVRAHRSWTSGRTVAGSLPHPGDRTGESRLLLAGLGAMWSAGAAVDWAAFHAGEHHHPVRLPGYAFQRRRFWVEPDRRTTDRAKAPAAASPADWFSSPGWKRLPFTPQPDAAAPSAVWVLLGAELPLGRALAARLTAAGEHVVRVTAGDTPGEDTDGGWTADPADREHLAAVLRSPAVQEAGQERRIHLVHLWSAAIAPHDGPPTEERLEDARRLGFDSLLALAQALADTRPEGRVTLDVLCRGVFAVTGDEPLQPENATVLGACTVIPQETPGTACRALDITGADPHAPHDGLVEALHTALTSSSDEPELALRGRHWWRRDFDAVTLDGADRTGLRDGGGYLITGGLGGIGLAMAEHIARTVDRPVLGLLGRSPFPAEDTWDDWLAGHDRQDPVSVRIRRLRHLAERGARVLVLQADVTDEEQTARAAQRVRDLAGALHGVVHAAGRPSQGMILTKSRAEADDVLAAKTRGTLVLDRVCREDRLDFLLLCSSVTALLGGPGQSDYAAANAFLDAFAQWKRQVSGTAVTAVGWDTWREVGMAAGLTDRFGAGSTGTPTGHPLLQRLVHTGPGSRTYATTLSTEDHWIVGDHRIMGHGLVPGTAYLELVRAAVAEQAAGRTIEIGDVQYLTPVVVPDGQTREVFTTVEERDGQWRFAVRSRTGAPGAAAWTDHALGSLAFHDSGPDTVRDLTALAADCGVTHVLDTPETIQEGLRLDRFQRGGPIEFSFGPRWDCMHRIEVGPNRLFATLGLGPEHAADLDDYLLHPALLDAVGGTARVYATDTYYLPFSYRSLRVHHGLTPTIHCLARLKESTDATGETMTCDLEVLDPEGRVLVEITDFTIKRINDLEGLRDQIARSAAPPAETGSGTPDAAGGVLSALGEGISEEQGQDAFARILAASDLPGHLLVCHRDMAELRDLARSLTPELLAREMEQFAAPGGVHPRPDLATPFVAPRTEREQAVAGIWCDILGLERVGVDDDFFALGGHSLAAVQIGTRIKSLLGVELELRAFFDNPTVAHTVTLLTAGPRAQDPEDVIEVLARDEQGPDPDSADDLSGPSDLSELSDLSDEEVEAQLRALLAAEGEQS